jgi:hypothetical protein
MITTIAGLLRELQVTEAEKLKREKMTHAPTIGDMYEGLTKEILGRTIPDSLDVRVVTGFAVGVNSKLSPQLDIMIVRGEGHPIPYTDAFCWPIGKVLAVFEIKKTLFGAALNDGVAKMNAVLALYKEAANTGEIDGANLMPAVKSFARLTGHFPLSDEAARALPGGNNVVFDIFKQEQGAPVRIIWGYGGYTDEAGLRKGFIKNMSQSKDHVTFMPENLPSLIVCNNNAILKMNGQPYVSAMRDDSWQILTSNSENPLRLLLELLWTRLSTELNTSFQMDDTLVMEKLAPFLSVRMELDGDSLKVAYEQNEVSKFDLKSLPERNWKPEPVNINDSILVSGSTRNGGLDIGDSALRDWAKSESYDLDAAVMRLVDQRILAWTGEKTLRPIANTVMTTIMPDGQISTSDNPDLLSLWLNSNKRTRL